MAILPTFLAQKIDFMRSLIYDEMSNKKPGKVNLLTQQDWTRQVVSQFDINNLLFAAFISLPFYRKYLVAHCVIVTIVIIELDSTLEFTRTDIKAKQNQLVILSDSINHLRIC